MGLISVIIPVMHDASRLERTVLHTQYEAGLWPTEIILANGGGERITAVAQSLGVRSIDCAGEDRAAAMNCGASAAKGEVLLFLAPDSLVPRRFTESIWWALRDPRIVGGAFDFEFDPFPHTDEFTRHQLTAVRLLNRIRFRWTGNFLIEQGMFVRQEAFARIGGFRGVKRLEDLYFSRSMKRLGRTAVLGPPMQTSARRFLRGGVARQFVTDLLLLFTDGFGFQPGRKANISQNPSQLMTTPEVIKGED